MKRLEPITHMAVQLWRTCLRRAEGAAVPEASQAGPHKIRPTWSRLHVSDGGEGRACSDARNRMSDAHSMAEFQLATPLDWQPDLGTSICRVLPPLP